MILISAVVAVAAIVVSASLAALNARRAAYERVMDALDYVSQGAVAAARHKLGTVVYDHNDDVLHRRLISYPPQERSDRIENLFSVLWAATRLDAVRVSLGRRSFGSFGPHYLLEQSLSSWVKYWMQPEPDARGKNRISRIIAVAECLGARLDVDDMRSLNGREQNWPDAHKSGGLPATVQAIAFPDPDPTGLNE